MAAVHKKFLNRLKEENSSSESTELDAQANVYKSTDEDVDSKGCTESETDSTNREKTESPVSEESTTSYEAKDSSSSDETGDSSSEKLTIVTSSSLEEDVYVKREVTSPTHENDTDMSTVEQAPQSEGNTSSTTSNMIADTTIKSETFPDQLPIVTSLNQGSVGGNLNSSLLVHPAPTYNSSTSRSEAIARSYALSSASSSSSAVVNGESPRKKIIYQHQTNSSYSSNESYSTSTPVDSTVGNSYSGSPSERQTGSEILRSAITGNTKLIENKSTPPGVKYIITQNRKSRPETKFSGTSPQYHKFNGSSSHSTNYGSPNRSLPGQVAYRPTQNVNHGQDVPGSSPNQRFSSPSPSRASYNHHHSEQGGNFSQTSSPIRSTSRPGMPTSYRYSPQNASAAKPTYQNMQTPGRSGVPPRRLSEGSHQTVLVRCPKKSDSGFQSSFMSSINGGSPLGGVTPQGVMMPPSLLSTVHATSSTHSTMSSPSNPTPPSTTFTSAPPLTEAQPQANSGGHDSSPHFCLRWNNHGTNLIGTLSSVMATEQYADVTIYCEGSIIKVHKLVLLASSSHFEKLLRHTPDNQHPFIVMDGTKLSDIQCLVEYMYKGKVNIAQDNITSLLKTAERLQIKGLTNLDSEGSRNALRETSTDRVREPSHPRPSSASSAPQMQSSMSPPPKRSRISPVDNILRDSAWKDRSDSDLRMEPRDLSRESNRDWMKDLSADRLGDYRSGSRDREVDGVKREVDPSSRSSNPFQTTNGPTSNGQRRHTPSPVSSSPSARNGVGPSPYYSRASQYDQLLPPRSSPKSPDNKITNNLGLSSFGLPFGLSNLPMMQDSKKLLGANPNMLLQGNRFDGEERAPSREHERYPASWPHRHNDYDRSDRDSENAGERSREVGEQKLNILHKALLQHKPGQPMDIDRHHSLPHMLSYPLPQKHPFGSMPAPHTHGSTVSFPQASPHYSGGSFTAEAHFDVKNLKTLKDLADPDRSHEDDKGSMSPPHDKSQYSPPSDDSGGSTKHELDSLVMDEEEENSRSSTVGSNGSLGTDIKNTKVYKKTVKTGTAEEKVKCPYCSKAYRHQNNLRTHIRCFHKGVRIPCPICKRGFTRWFTVRCHIAREHAGEPIPNFDKIPANMRKQLSNHPPYSDPGQMPSLGQYPDELRLGNSNAGLFRYGEPHHSNSALPSQP